MQTIYNVGVYARLSREDERENESVSIENQKEMLCRHVKEQGWNLYNVYADDGYSGTSFDRPALNLMIADATDKKINLILCKDLSRFGRDYIEVGKYMDCVFPAIGCRFIALQDGVDTLSKNNDLLMIFKNVLNDAYSRDMGNKIRAAKLSVFKTGKYISCYAPYGYIKDPNDHHKLIIDEYAAAVVRRIFDMRCHGYGYMYIANKLNEEKILPPRTYYYKREGRPNPCNNNNFWNSTTVKTILIHESYIGNTVQNKTGNISYKNRKHCYKPKEEWIKVEGTHEPVISLDVWERACAVNNAMTRPKLTKYGEISPFSGLVFCMECGYAMKYNQDRRELKSGLTIYKNYRCGNHSRSGRMACTPHIIALGILIEIVVADIKQKLALVECNEDELLARIGQSKAAESKTQLVALTTAKRAADNRHTELERLIQSLYEDKVKGEIAKDICTRLINQYEAERLEKAEEMQILATQIENFQAEQSNTQEWVNVIRQFGNIETIDRDTILKLVDKIEVGERNVLEGQKQREIRIHYKFVGYIG